MDREAEADKKKPPEGGFVKVPEGTSLEPVEASLLVGLSSFLLNCDSSWMNFSAFTGFAVSPIRVSFGVFIEKNQTIFDFFYIQGAYGGCFSEKSAFHR